MSSKAGNIIRQLAPVAIGAATGMPWLGALAGGINSASQGGNLLQTGLGALGGYGGASLGNWGANALQSAGGLTGAISDAASSAGDFLSGAGTSTANFLAHPIDTIGSGLSSVGTKLSSLLSGSGTGTDITAAAPGVANGASNILSAGGTAGAGNALDLSAPGALTGLGTAGSNALTVGAPAASAAGLASGGALTGVGSGASSVGSSSSFGANGLANLLSGVGNLATEGKAKDDLLNSQQQSLAALKPFLANGTAASNTLADKLGTSGNTTAAGYGDLTKPFSPTDLTNDPGYKFNKSQGEIALNNRLAASGMLGSGAALKAGEEFGNGLADTTYNNAFNRDLATKNQQVGALSGAAAPGLAAGQSNQNVNTNIGLTNAGADVSQGNTITSTLSNLLTGGGSKQIIGYKLDGTPIYA